MNHQNGKGGPGGAVLSQTEIEKVREYLVLYRNGCERVCYANTAQVSEDDETVVTSPTTNGEEDSDMNGTEDVVVIGEHEFQPLSDKVLSQPFMELPRTLSSKNRRVIHKLCVDGE